MGFDSWGFELRTGFRPWVETSNAQKPVATFPVASPYAGPGKLPTCCQLVMELWTCYGFATG